MSVELSRQNINTFKKCRWELLHAHTLTLRCGRRCPALRRMAWWSHGLWSGRNIYTPLRTPGPRKHEPSCGRTHTHTHNWYPCVYTFIKHHQQKASGVVPAVQDLYFKQQPSEQNKYTQRKHWYFTSPGIFYLFLTGKVGRAAGHRSEATELHCVRCFNYANIHSVLIVTHILILNFHFPGSRK